MVVRTRCVVLCTVCVFVSDWHGHVRGWEGSMARRSRGFGSPRHCSEMSFPSLWRECILYCSYGIRREVLLSGLKRVIVLSRGPYSCLFWRMCNAYGDCGLLFFYVPCMLLIP